MNFKDKTLNTLKKELPSGFTKRQAQKALKLFDSFGKQQLETALEQLIADGALLYDSKLKKYLLAQSSQGVIKGKLSGNARGFGFVVSEDGSTADTFVPASALNGALHGDTVIVKLIAAGSDEGRILRVLSRGTETVVGTLSLSRGYGFIVPDDLRFSSDIYVQLKDLSGAKNGDKVVVKITAYPDKKRRNPEGKIIEILGREGDDGLDVLSIIRSFGLYEEFPPAVLQAAQKIPAQLFGKDIEGREDLRSLSIITIDGEDAKDLDDAISLEKIGKLYRLGVHIADVSHYVKSGSLIDKEAFERGTSVYFPDRVLPMLPRELSNGICSLSGGLDRLCLSIFMDVDFSGKVVDHRFASTVINTRHRMTYTSVTAILQGDDGERKKYSDVISMLKLCSELADILTAKRVKRGSINFDLPEPYIEIDSKGDIVDITQYPRTISHRIIEEFMILANETVAESVAAFELPFVYRVHEPPTEEKLAIFREFLAGMGYNIGGKSGKVSPNEFSGLLARIEGQPAFSIINKVMLRTMMKAKYSPDNIGHFGLASQCYCHFTSPIRRYPDLMVHRIVKLMLSGGMDKKTIDRVSGPLYSQSEHCSERERMAEEAEREVDDFFKAKYMAGKIGEEFDGVISGVTEFGIFVQLQNTVEGLVRVSELPDDDYAYVKNQFALIGNARSYRLGEKVRVRAEGVNLSSKKVDFSLVTG